MYDKFITYNEIFDGQKDVPETLEKTIYEADPHTVRDLVIIFEITDTNVQIDSFIEIQQNKIDFIDKKMHYAYNEFGQRIDKEIDQKRSKNVLENITWKEEINVVEEREKINILRYIAQKGLMIDKFKFLGEHDLLVTCLSVVI